MNLRIRGPEGQTVLQDLDSQITVSELLDRVSTATNIAKDNIILKGGYPVKPIEIPEDGSVSAKESMRLMSNDLLVVSMKASRQERPPVQVGVNVDPSSRPTAAAAAAAAAPPSMNEDEMLARAIAASLGEEIPGQHQQGITIPGVLEKGKPGFELLDSGKAVVRRIVPDDNSCLFSSVAYCVQRGRMGASEMRSLVAQAVVADPFQWNEAILGREPSEYAAWILDASKWGGAIELTILSQQLAVEISAFDIQTQRVDTYGEGSGYSKRILVVYDGLHYDALALAAYEGAPESQDVTMFSHGPLLDQVLQGASSLVCRYHDLRQYTDTSKFTLRCNICQLGLIGEKEALQHAQATGHQNFSEY